MTMLKLKALIFIVLVGLISCGSKSVYTHNVSGEGRDLATDQKECREFADKKAFRDYMDLMQRTSKANEFYHQCMFERGWRMKK
jgi:hypothetical protein